MSLQIRLPCRCKWVQSRDLLRPREQSSAVGLSYIGQCTLAGDCIRKWYCPHRVTSARTPFNKLASLLLWWRQIDFYNLCHWPGPQQSDQYWARFARRHCRWKVDQICHGFCWLLPNNQEAIPLEDLPFSFDSHTSICSDTLYAHTAWQCGCGCVANVNEIAIKRPQRNQSLLPLDRSRCFRVVYPLYPVSVSLDGLGHEKMNTCCKKKIWGKNHESLLPKIFFTRIA